MAQRDKKTYKSKKIPKKKRGSIGFKIKETTADVLNDIRYGKSVSVTFFKSNAWLLILFVAVVLALIGIKYKTRTKMAEIKDLEKELAVSQSEMLREKSAYMTLIRETEMLRLVKKNGLGLIFQEQPPYQVSLDDAKK